MKPSLFGRLALSALAGRYTRELSDQGRTFLRVLDGNLLLAIYYSGQVVELLEREPPRQTVNDRNIRALVEGCRARGHRVQVGGELFSDAMGPPGTPEGTYVGMVRHNVETITEALK